MIEKVPKTATSWQFFNQPNNMLIPALSIQHVRSIKKGETLNGHPLTMWENDSLLNMDAAFISASQLYNYSEDSLKGFPQSLKFPPDFLLMMDSGGFDIIRHPELSKVYKQERVSEIQQTIADQFHDGIVGMVLDYPPYQLVQQDGKKKLMFKDDFLVDMQKTAKNTEIALSCCKSNLMLYAVLHGMEPYQLNACWNVMHVFKGRVRWALCPKPLTSYIKTAMYSCFAIQNLDAPIHILGHGGFNSLAIIIYMLREDKNGIPYYPHLITSDSTSHDAGAKYRNYRIPGDFRFNIVIGRDEDVKLNHLPCLCPACSNSTPAQVRESTNEGGIAVGLHDLWWAKFQVTVLTALIASPDKYINYVLSQNRDFKTKNSLRGLFTLMDSIVAYKRGYSKIKASWEDVDAFGKEGVWL